MQRLLPALALLPVLAAAAPPLNPDTARRADTAVLTAAHSGYTFRTLDLTDDSGAPHRIYVGIPDAPPPPAGYPALYALDGNAVLEHLDPDTLRRLPDPPLLVLAGYPTDLRFDTARRAYDYTPPDEHGRPAPDPLAEGRRNGGAPALLDLLTRRLRPQIAALAPTDPARQTLWGHSYGGLFVLHTLFEQPRAFTHYAAADPALWWRNGQMLRRAEHAIARPQALHGRSLRIDKSGAPDAKQPANAQQAAMLARREAAVRAVPPDAAEKLAARLRPHTRETRYTAYPEATHGSLFGLSFRQTLADTAQQKP